MSMKKKSFTPTIIRSEAILSLPPFAQILYIQMFVDADDEGFVDNIGMIMRLAGAAESDLNALIRARFVLRFQSGVCVIRHWVAHSTIKKDRFKPTKYTYERSLLEVDASGAYVERTVQQPVQSEHEESETDGSDLEPTWNQVGAQLEPVVRTNGTQLEPSWNQDGAQMEPSVRTAGAQPAPQLPSGQNKPQGTGITVIPLSTKIPDSNEQQKYIYNNTHNCCCSETNGDYTDPRNKQEAQGDIPQGSTDPDSRDDLVEFVDNLIADMNSRRWESLRELRSEGMSDELVRYAVRRAVDYGHRDWAYVSKILDRWVVEGVRTLEDVAASDARHIPGARNRASPRPNSRLPNQPPELKPGESPYSNGNEWNEQYGAFIPT